MAEDDPYDPQSFPKGGDLSEYTRGLDTGNPIMDMLSTLLMGKHYMPRPQGTQSTYDALMQQQRAYNFIKMQSDGFTNNQFSQQMGIDPNSMLMRSAGFMFGSPNGFAMRMLSPLIGGNPIAAQQQMYAGFTASTMGAFGRTDNIGYGESASAMKALTDGFYTHHPFTQDMAKTAQDRLYGQFEKRVRDGGDDMLKSYGLTKDSKPQDFANALEGSKGKFSGVDSILMDINGAKSDMAGMVVPSSSSDDLKKEATDAMRARASNLMQALQKSGVDKQVLDKYLGDPEHIDLSGLAHAISNDPALVGTKGLADINAMIGKPVIGSIDYKKTRGFNLEDFSSAGIAAADLQLIGSSNAGPRELYGKIMGDKEGNFGGMLSAARSTFGRGKSGGELVQDISRMLGADAADMSSPEGAKEIETMLRNTKAAARIAGASIDSVMGIIKEAQSLAQSRPELRYLSGKVTTELTQKALLTATAVNSVAGAEEIRRGGGVQGIAGAQISGDQAVLASQPAAQFAALREMFKGSKAATGELDAYASKGSMDNWSGEMQGIVNKYGKDVGVNNVFDAIARVNSPEAQRIALQHGDTAASAHDFAANYIKDFVFKQQDWSTPGWQNDLKAAFAKDPKMDVGQWGAQHFTPVMEAMMNKYDPNNIELRKLADPTFAAHQAELEGKQKMWATADADIDRKTGFANAPVIQRMFQSALSGDFGKNGLVDTIMGGLRNYDEKGVPYYAGAGASAEDEAKAKAAFDSKQKNLDTYVAEINRIQGHGAGSNVALADRAGKTSDAVTAYLTAQDPNAFEGRNSATVLDKYKGLLGASDYGDMQAMVTNQAGDADVQTAFHLMQKSGIDSNNFKERAAAGVAGLPIGMTQKELDDRMTAALEPERKSAESAMSADFAKAAGVSDNGAYTTALANTYKGSDGSFDPAKYADAMEHGTLDKDMEKAGTPMSGFNQTAVDNVTKALSDDTGRRNDIVEKGNAYVQSKKDEASGDIPTLLNQILGKMGDGGLSGAIGGLATALTTH